MRARGSSSCCIWQRERPWGFLFGGSKAWEVAIESHEVEQSRSTPQPTHCSNKLDTMNNPRGLPLHSFGVRVQDRPPLARSYSWPLGSVTSRRASRQGLPLWALGSSPSEACRAHAKRGWRSLSAASMSPRDDKTGSRERGKRKEKVERSAAVRDTGELCLASPTSQVVLRLPSQSALLIAAASFQKASGRSATGLRETREASRLNRGI